MWRLDVRVWSGSCFMKSWVAGTRRKQAVSVLWDRRSPCSHAVLKARQPYTSGKDKKMFLATVFLHWWKDVTLSKTSVFDFPGIEGGVHALHAQHKRLSTSESHQFMGNPAGSRTGHSGPPICIANIIKICRAGSGNSCPLLGSTCVPLEDEHQDGEDGAIVRCEQGR